ncbi:MAG: hypothetical protein JXA57_00170, partial [Armatimonadetes bacterium]|nr:hypothetical protein [Armatimonadota bacterium]
VHDLTLESTFVLNYLALPRLLPGRNRVTVAAGGTECRNEKLEVTYAWTDREGDDEDRRIITTLPETYEIEVAPVSTVPPENPKYMRFLRMGLV